MGLLPTDWRCAVAVGISCPALPAEARPAEEYLRSLAEQAESLGLRLQLFSDAQAAQTLPELRALVGRGHALDLQSELLGGDDMSDRLRASSGALSEGTGSDVVGVRAADMGRLGLQRLPRVQEGVAGCGLRFVNSDYSTKLPDGPAVGFADKNAAMLIKHTQPRWYRDDLLEIPSAGYSARDFLVAQGRPVEAWCDHLRQCLDFAYDIGGLLYAPALDLPTLEAHDPDLLTVPALVQHALARRSGRVAFCTYREIHARAAETEDR